MPRTYEQHPGPAENKAEAPKKETKKEDKKDSGGE